jgi:tripartite-type tricarboxylate transporter receptor subunit TctC
VKSRGACLFFAAIVVLSSSMPARCAEDYPARPIKLVVGAPAGGTTDTIARFIAEPMGAALKQPVLVENRPGAGGNLPAAAVAKSPPDGYTLLVSFSSHTINATLYPTLPYDPVADSSVFAPANLPGAVTERLNTVIVGAVAEPKLREQLKSEGATAVGDSSKEFAAFVSEDIERWAPLVKSSGATPN